MALALFSYLFCLWYNSLFFFMHALMLFSVLIWYEFMKSMVPIWVCVVMLASFIILSNLGSGCCWIKTPKPSASCLAYYALHYLVLVIPGSVLVFKLLWILSFLSSCCEEMHIFLVLWCDFIQFWFGSWLGGFEIHSFGLLSPFFLSHLLQLPSLHLC